MSETGKLEKRIYGAFRGADFRGDDVNMMRSPDCLNVWKDYKGLGGICTRPGTKEYASFKPPVDSSVDSSVYGIFFFKGEMIVHSGNKLYSVKNGATKELYNGVRAAKSNGFVCHQVPYQGSDYNVAGYKDYFFFKDGEHYLQYDGETFEDVVGYVPTTSIGRSPLGGGTTYEDVNMLSPYRKNSFVANGESVTFYLDVRNIDEGFVPVVYVNGEKKKYLEDESGDYTVNYEGGSISFAQSPSAPLTDGQDNVVVIFKKTIEGFANNVLKSTLLQTFDNRVFVSGNPDFPNTMWHCSLDNPTYFSDLDYYREGLGESPIKGLVAGNNALWVFCEPSDANTTIFYHTPTNDVDYGKIYPSQHSSISTGCVGGAINFNDDIVFFSDRGMEGISADITTEQVIGHRSTLVDSKLVNSEGYNNMILEEWEGYLLVIIGDKVFLADSRGTFPNNGHHEYEWFYWDLGKAVKSTAVKDGVLYLGTADGIIYTLNDSEADVESYWVTPKDKFNAPQMLKTTNKRGCVAEARGDIFLYAKTEKTDFALVGDYKDVEDYFVSRIKLKKWKDIQLKFYSSTRFSLETATLEAFVGGYIKR